LDKGLKMKRYKIQNSCIYDRETKTTIPKTGGNLHFQNYLRWVAKGNEPDPEFTVKELEQKAAQEEKQRLEVLVQNKMRELAIQTLKADGELTQDEIDAHLK
jgi:hypothetical protein